MSSTDRPNEDARRSARHGGAPDPQIGALQDEVDALRRRLTESPRHLRALEERVADLQADLASLTTQNERLVSTLKDARDQIITLKEEVDRLAQPPAGFGVFLQRNDDATVDIFTGGRKLRVAVSPGVELEDLVRGQEVMLNEAMNVVAALQFEQIGEVVTLKEVLADGERALVVGHTDEEKVVRLAEPLREERLRVGESLLLEPRSGYVYERVPKSEVEELVLEEVPDIDYTLIGGLAACVDEFKENEDLPNTTNPDDWARISGKKGERIVYIRTLIQGKQGTEAGRSIDTVANTGQYL